MIKIAHRGNTKGKSPYENQVWYLEEAIHDGYDVEADVWLDNNNLFLGHDGPAHPIDDVFVERYKDKVWFHCKNFDALNYFITTHRNAKFFWHQNDNHALTSTGHIWTYPGKEVGPNSIIVDFYNDREYEIMPYGICSDYWINID